MALERLEMLRFLNMVGDMIGSVSKDWDYSSLLGSLLMISNTSGN